jgi:hypothetical protein
MMSAVVFNFHLFLLLLVVERIALTVWGWVASIDAAISALAPSLAVQRPASATAAFADIQCDFVSERPSLVEGAVAVKLRTSVTCVIPVGDVVTVN